MCIPLIPALKRWRKVDLCEFATSLVYRASSCIARTTQRNPSAGGGGRKKKKKKIYFRLSLGQSSTELYLTSGDISNSHESFPTLVSTREIFKKSLVLAVGTSLP